MNDFNDTNCRLEGTTVLTLQSHFLGKHSALNSGHGSDLWVSLGWERSAVPEGAVGAQDQTIPQEIQKTDCSVTLISLV